MISDLATPPRLVALVGYVGASTRDGCKRVYLSLELDTWVDVPTDKFLYYEEYSESPLAGTVVWLAADTKIYPDKQHDLEGFMDGRIARQFVSVESVQLCRAPSPLCKSL